MDLPAAFVNIMLHTRSAQLHPRRNEQTKTQDHQQQNQYLRPPEIERYGHSELLVYDWKDKHVTMDRILDCFSLFNLTVQISYYVDGTEKNSYIEYYGSRMFLVE